MPGIFSDRGGRFLELDDDFDFSFERETGQQSPPLPLLFEDDFGPGGCRILISHG
jgi:hypothetical protein